MSPGKPNAGKSRGILQTFTRLLCRIDDTEWTVVLKKAAAVAETSTVIK